MVDAQALPDLHRKGVSWGAGGEEAVTECVPYALTLEIPGLPPTPNQLLAADPWARKKIRDDWHRRVWAAVGTHKPPKPLPEAHLVLVRCSSRQPDADALYGCWKAVIDGLVMVDVLEDDKATNVTLECRWQKTKPKEGRIKIAVTEGLQR